MKLSRRNFLLGSVALAAFPAIIATVPEVMPTSKFIGIDLAAGADVSVMAVVTGTNQSGYIVTEILTMTGIDEVESNNKWRNINSIRMVCDEIINQGDIVMVADGKARKAVVGDLS